MRGVGGYGGVGRSTRKPSQAGIADYSSVAKCSAKSVAAMQFKLIYDRKINTA